MVCTKWFCAVCWQEFCIEDPNKSLPLDVEASILGQGSDGETLGVLIHVGGPYGLPRGTLACNGVLHEDTPENRAIWERIKNQGG